MKKTMNGLLFFFLVVSEIVLLAGNAQAKIAMPEREYVQTIVWLVEFSTFVIAAAIAVFVWRLSKRDSKNKKSKQGD